MKLIALTTLAVTITACTHHRSLRDVSSLAGERVTVETAYAPGIPQDGVVGVGDYGVVVATTTGTVDLASVKRVTDVSHAWGALEGTGVGALVGVVGGAVLGYASGDDPCTPDGHEDCYYAFTAGENAMLGGIVLGMLGGVIGLVVGAARGSDFVYEF